MIFVLATALALATALWVSPDFRKNVGFSPAPEGYGWLTTGLDRARTTAETTGEGVTQVKRRGASVALERAIRHSRANARRLGVRPIPAHVRKVLTPYFPADTLNQVHWTLAKRQLDLGTLVAAWYRREGGAVTLGETIVYSDPATSSNELLWAHELTHVMQYEELGIRGFARLYVANYQLIEQQAWANTRRIAGELARVRASRKAGEDQITTEAGSASQRHLFGTLNNAL